jgi:hypothetical protein
VTEFTLVTGELPAGEYNVRYSVRLEASDAGATFALTGGALPEGLTLDTDGRLTGVPLDSGEFAFEITATLPDGRSASREFTLLVRRKRWLAYISDEGDPGHARLYLVDITQGLLPKTTISASVTTGTGVAEFAFSPPGNWLGYTARSTTGEELQLFVADVSGTTGSVGVPLTNSGQVSGFSFRPDGSGVAYHWRATNTPGEPWELRYAELGDGAAGLPITIGPSAGFSAPIHWIHNSLLVYGNSGDLRVTRVTETGAFTAAQSLAQPGQVRAWNSATEAVALTQEWPTGCGRTAVLLQLASGDAFPAPADDSYTRWPVFSPDLTQVVLWNGTNAQEVFRATQLDAAPLGTISAAFCSVSSWNPAGNLLATAWGNDEPRLAISQIGSTISSHVVPGDYEMPYTYTMHWTRNDQLVFATDDRLHRIDVVDGEPAAARDLNPPFASAHAISALFPAPNGRGVAYVAPQETAGRPEVFVASTDAAEPQVRRALAFNENWRSTEILAWSADSSRLAFVVRTDVRETDYASRLYLVDMVSQTATAVAVNPAACYTSGCTRSTAPAFQP